MKTKKFLLSILLIIITGCIGNVALAQRISILGDSYSTFKGYVEPDTNAVWYPEEQNKNDVKRMEQTWWYQFTHNYGYQLEVNNSFSGSTICNTGYRKADYSDRSFITRMDKLGNPDIIFIFGATNDCWARSPIGDYIYSDWKTEDLYSFRPAMAYLLENLKKLYPQAKLYFILNNELTETINSSVHTICQHYQVDCINLYNIDKQRNHPSVAGMSAISLQLKHYLDQKEKEELKGELKAIRKELSEIKKELKNRK